MYHFLTKEFGKIKMCSSIEKENRKWVVLLASTAQCMVFVGIWSCGGIYMEDMKKVSAARYYEKTFCFMFSKNRKFGGKGPSRNDVIVWGEGGGQPKGYEK